MKKFKVYWRCLDNCNEDYCNECMPTMINPKGIKSSQTSIEGSSDYGLPPPLPPPIDNLNRNNRSLIFNFINDNNSEGYDWNFGND